MARPRQFDRDQVLQRALRLFWQRGLHNTSMRDLERALDMRPGSIYATFGSKDQLFDEALRLYSVQAGVRFAQDYASHPSPMGGLIAHLRDQLGCEEPGLRACHLLKTVMSLTTDTEHGKRADGLLADAVQMFAERFEAAKEHGELPPSADAQRLARRYQSNIMGLQSMASRSMSEVDQQALVEDMVEELLATLTPRGREAAGAGEVVG